MKKIYYNGNFITLENYEIEALLIENGLIKELGSLDKVLSFRDRKTEVINLEGKTIMPSFIDSHSHFSGVANNYLKVNLENCTNFEEIQQNLRKFKKDKNIPDNEWILAEGYDNNVLDEKNHPRKNLIDMVLPNNPVVLQHKSGHVGVFNSKALEILKVSENPSSLQGGLVEKIDGKFSGYMEENVFLHYLQKIPLPSLEILIEAYCKAQDEYLSYGITTIQDGMLYDSMIPIYKNLLNTKKLKLDLVSYISPTNNTAFFDSFKEHIRKYKNNFKLGGYKIFLDGSPQGRTAWMRTPYLNDNNYYGYGTMSNDDVEKAIKSSLNSNIQLLAHCNGDKACEQFIDCIKKYVNKIKNLRPVMIHAQLLGIDQIDNIKKFNIIPSFFVSHVYYWGDTHINNFGFERASKISPANTALQKDVLFTFHQDSPVIKPNMFETIWCAVSRKTKSGVILGLNETIDVKSAIKAVTINSAFQYFEEDIKGSIKKGKLANLIIVDKNPLSIKFEDIKNIKVLETIKEGKTLYKS